MALYVATSGPNNEVDVPPPLEMAVRAFLSYATSTTNGGTSSWGPAQWVVVNNQTSATALYAQTAEPFPDGQPSTVEVVTGTNPVSSSVQGMWEENYGSALSALQAVASRQGFQVNVTPITNWSAGLAGVTITLTDATGTSTTFTQQSPPQG